LACSAGYRSEQVIFVNVTKTGGVKMSKGNKEHMGWREALRELVATLVDAWQCADLHGHLTSWWGVVTGATKVE
jgi:hypothetical protein